MNIWDSCLVEKEETRRIRPPATLWVTDLTTPCPQAAYLAIKIDRPHPLPTLRIFEAGNILEASWVKLLRKHGSERVPQIRVLATQVPLSYPFNLNEEVWHINGRADLLCLQEGKLTLHEVKTAKTVHWLKAPKEEHMNQIQFYLNVLGLKYGVVDYIDKTSLLMGDAELVQSFPLTSDDAAFTLMLERAKTLAQYLSMEKPPPPTPEAWNGKYCEYYCLYRDLCEGPAQ